MTTLELYRKHKAGEVSREKFIYEVRKDSNLPWVTNTTSYTDAVKILKNKGIISEMEISENFEVHFSDGIRQAKKFKDLRSAQQFAKQLVATNKNLQHVDIFKGGIHSTADPKGLISWWGPGSYFDNMSKKDPSIASKQMSLNEVDANLATDPAVDRVNPYFLKRGVNKLLSKEDELTNDSYIKALNKAGKALAKNPHAFDDEMFANDEDVKKAYEKLEMEDVKKGNLNDKANEMKKVKVKTKSLKEAALEELTNSLKKKESINEDTHWKHTVGSQVVTPEGAGTIKEINGGTLTVELKDGSLKDFQINTIDHHTQKANEVGQTPEPTKDEPSKDDVKDMWAKWDKEGHKPFGGMLVDPEHFKKPLDMDKIKQYMERFKDDKQKMSRLKEALKKIKEAVKFHAGGEVIFTKDADAAGYEADLKNAGVKYRKEKVV